MRHNLWLEDGSLLRDADILADIPLSGVGFLGAETPSRVGAGVAWMWSWGPCGRPLGWKGLREPLSVRHAGSHKGPNPAPHRPCPYAIPLTMAKNLPLRADIPGILVNGRFDFQSPIANAWELNRVWPRAELMIVDNTGHAANNPG